MPCRYRVEDVGMDDVKFRARRETDLGNCVGGLRSVHDADGYPMNWPADPQGWLTPPGMLQAWVAEFPRGVIAGHLALLRVTAPDPTDASARPYAEVTRLFVTPAARRRSVATALLDQAVRWVGGHGYQLTLNVVDERGSAAVAVYEATGWRHTHTTLADWTTPAGEPVYLRHYVRTG
jgi:GNAT superfamily N-acetyltransferase